MTNKTTQWQLKWFPFNREAKRVQSSRHNSILLRLMCVNNHLFPSWNCFQKNFFWSVDCRLMNWLLSSCVWVSQHSHAELFYFVAADNDNSLGPLAEIRFKWRRLRSHRSEDWPSDDRTFGRKDFAHKWSFCWCRVQVVENRQTIRIQTGRFNRLFGKSHISMPKHFVTSSTGGSF